MSKLFKPQYRLCDSVLSFSDNVLLLNNAEQQTALCQDLSEEGSYTRLLISSGVGFEEITVTCNNSVLTVTPMPKTTYVKGDTVWFECCTVANMRDIMNCVETEDDDEDTANPKIEGYKLVRDPDTGQLCYEVDPTAQGTYKFVSCGYEFEIPASAIERTALPSSRVPRDGVYAFAQVTVVDGCIVAVKEGTPPVSGGCCCCGSGKCSETVSDSGVV